MKTEPAAVKSPATARLTGSNGGAGAGDRPLRSDTAHGSTADASARPPADPVPALNAGADAVRLLTRGLEAAARIEGVDAPACRQLQERITEGRFSLIVAGEFNRGKSSVVNALLGTAVLPVAVVPLTSVLTVIRHGAQPRTTVHFLAGRERDIAPEDLADYVTEGRNPNNAKGVESVTLEYPSAWLAAGIQIVDTPGIGSVHQHNTDLTQHFLPQADAVLFVAAADQPMTRAELDFLADIRSHAGKVVCLLNKADHLAAAELREAQSFAAAAVREALGAPVALITLSARDALNGQLQHDAALLERSRLPELQRALRQLLGEERRAIWVTSLSGGLRRILARARLGIGVEQKSLAEPVERIEALLDAFTRKKRDALQAMADDHVLIDAEARKLVKDMIEPDLARFKAALGESLAADVVRRFDDLKDLPSKRLAAELEDYVVGRVRAAFDDWRAAEDVEVARAFNALCERFWRHVDDVADVLLKQSAELFSLSYEAARSASGSLARPDFRYKFWSAPDSLSLLGATFVTSLPKLLGAPLIRERAKRRAADLVETQAGRLRHDFEERLKTSTRSLNGELSRVMESTVAGIESAIVNGSALRRRSEAEAAARREALDRSMAEIARIEAGIADISGPRPAAAGAVG